MTQTGLVCDSCGAQSSPTAKFCSECGTRLAPASEHAEYKQVTVLFADVVHSMDIAAAVGPERLREIMAELVDRSSAVVARYRGTAGQEFVFVDCVVLHARALLARARGDESTYREFRDRYRETAAAIGYEGHLARAEAMP